MRHGGHLVLFDIDGTLMRGAGQHHKRALLEVVGRITGRAASFDGIATAGCLDRDLIAQLLRAAGESQRRTRSILRATMRACEEFYEANCPADLSAFCCINVKPTLEALAARGTPLALVTGNLTRIGWKKVQLAGLAAYFSTGAFAEDGRSRARLAKIAYWRARRLNLVQKNGRVSLIGDHPNDIAAAKANGFQSVGVATGVISFEELAAAQPDILVRHLGELDVSRVSG